MPKNLDAKGILGVKKCVLVTEEEEVCRRILLFSQSHEMVLNCLVGQLSGHTLYDYM